ncbi:MAG: translation elongation factor 4, partial [Desulfobacterales bacterium]|nr:translation elongation factor 4 [Desulfobacterales bacterium]
RDIDKVLAQVDDELGLDPDTAILASAKEWTGVEEILEAIVNRLPPPEGDPEAPARAMIFDSNYDPFRGTIVHFRMIDGTIRPGDRIMFMSNRAEYSVEEVGIFQIKRVAQQKITAGRVGYIIAGIKTVSDTKSGDTITVKDRPCQKPVPGFKEPKPVVFSSIYPVDTDEYQELAAALDKLKLNDASLVYEKDTSAALGFGFRCGFLGLLHLEIVQARLEREYDLSLIITAPSVKYEIGLNDGTNMIIENPAHYPDPVNIAYIREPYIRASIITPDTFMGQVMQLCLERRGINSNYQYFGSGRMELIFEMPLAEVVYDFYDRLKTVTQGYGSFDYEMLDYRESEIVRLDILINGERVDAFSQLVHKDKAEQRARQTCERLKEEIPRHMFKIAVQGAVGSKVIARETINAYRKDVTAKCYGGDVTRKRKLLEKQKKGKKRMKMAGEVMIPQSAFLAVLKGKE